MSPNKENFGTNNPILRFAKMEASGGILLFICAIIAMILANSGLSHWYTHLWHDEFKLSFDYDGAAFEFGKSLHFWINDFLMVIFFFLVGLEIKRELLVGELSSPKKALLPVVAALGGMVLPIAIFLLINGGKPGDSGWGIPMATDIAFSLGVLSLLGSRVPTSLKVFLTAFAIADDLGAVLVIAIFYGHGFHIGPFILAILVLAVMFVLNRYNVNKKWIYVLLGILVWYFFLHSGIHTTVAGVLVALMIPVSSLVPNKTFYTSMSKDLEHFNSEANNKTNELLDHHQLEALANMESRIKRVQSPLQSFEHGLQNFVTFFILPLFAFANAGVNFSGGEDGGSVEIFNSLPMAIMLGLMFGKLFGIYLFSWLAVKLKIANLPKGMDWKNLIGLSLLGGVGFTMALFVADLSFDKTTELGMTLLNNAKAGVLIASGITGLVGYLFLHFVLPKVTNSTK